MEQLLNDHLTIETPEQIPLTLPLAGIGSRFLALAIDTLIQLAVLALLVIAAIVILAGGSAWSPNGRIWIAALLILSYFLLMFGYFAIFEALCNGQTPGKRRLRLRVISDSGHPISTYDSVARNLLRIVDSIPGIYAVGILCALFSSQSRRLGDYVAGTVVVREDVTAPDLGLIPRVSARDGESTQVSGCDLSRLTVEEFGLVEAFLARRRQLSPELRKDMARQITMRIAAKLALDSSPQSSSETLIESVAAEYRNRASLRISLDTSRASH